jgi:hypothetical protein
MVIQASVIGVRRSIGEPDVKLAEEHIAFKVTPDQHDEIKRLIRLSVPDIKSSHCAEAVARGFRFGTNAAMVAELKSNKHIERMPARNLFEEFLKERRYNVETLQVSLFTDAVRIAAGSEWRPIRPLNIHYDIRACWACRDQFGSEGKSNRLCIACKLRDGRTIGFNHVGVVRRSILRQAFLNARSAEDWRYLTVRPGWAGFLASPHLKEEIADLIQNRHRVQTGDFSGMSSLVVDLLKTRTYLDVMDELEVPRKRAREWWPKAKALFEEGDYPVE